MTPRPEELWLELYAAANAWFGAVGASAKHISGDRLRRAVDALTPVAVMVPEWDSTEGGRWRHKRGCLSLGGDKEDCTCGLAVAEAWIAALEAERDAAQREVRECERFAAIFGPPGSPPPLVGSALVRWVFQHLTAENAALRADKARLDWLETAVPAGSFKRLSESLRGQWNGSFREWVDAALDAARKEEPS